MSFTNVPIAEVTVLEDRAHVVRRARVSLEPGQVRLTIDGVAPVLSDKTLLARIEGEGARVIDARVRRLLRSSSEDAAPLGSLEELRRELERLEDGLAALDAERLAGEERRDALEVLGKLTLSEVAEDVAWSKPAGAGFVDELKRIGEERRALCRARIDLAHRLDRQQRVIARLRGRISALDTPSEHVAAELDIDIAVDRAGKYLLSVDYVVPNACWRPYHRAQLIDGDERVRFESEACVWQNTGEPWDDVELVLSTERASLGVDPPELASDVLRVRRKREVLAVETREERIERTGVASVELLGIDDGGQTQELRGARRARIPSDGRPHRVPLSAFEAPVERSLESVPELSPAVVLRTVQDNGGTPILAGPVDLVRTGGLCGRTSLLFVAPQERFEMGWGPDSELRVSREVELEKDDSGIIGNWIARKHHVEVRLSNLGASERRVHVRERVPVSEIEKVKIEPHAKETTGSKVPDADGFVDWTVTLAPFGTAAVELCYTLRKHSDVAGL